MHVYLNKISGIDDAIVSMFISKRSWTRDGGSCCPGMNNRSCRWNLTNSMIGSVSW